MKDLLWHHGDGYAGDPLDVASVDPDPIAQFRRWFHAAESAGVPKVNAMTLATATADGRPSARIVLVKHVDEAGFRFFTNHGSRKAQELAENPRAALCFWWRDLHRQVRIEGAVERTSPADSDAYFAVRPRGSQLGAIASPQSRPIATRTELETRVAELDERYPDAPPRPATWGGYRVVPDRIEFWQGQPSRLHDRVCYRLVTDRWERERLAP